MYKNQMKTDRVLLVWKSFFSVEEGITDVKYFFYYSFLGGKLASLEEFKVHREELMAKFANMEKELEQKDEDHKSAIYDLEKKAVLDKSRLVALFRKHWSKTSFQFFLFF